MKLFPHPLRIYNQTQKGGARLKEELRLIRKIQKDGNRAAADTLVRKYYDEIFLFIRKQTASEATALDLTQEIFISLLKSLRRYDPKKGAGFRTWLYKIATDKAIDYFRSRAARLSEALTLDETEPVDETDFTIQIETQDFAAKVCVYVSNYPPDTQKIFRLHIYGGYTFAEIAQHMTLPEGSVKSRYYRLLNKIRGEFSD